MKTTFSFIACSLFIANAYANSPIDNAKNQEIGIKSTEQKPKFKISERRILKTKPQPKQEVEKSEEQVSSFSMEELRVGAQRILDKAEVQYYKSLCRYAFMSDRDVIENRCEAKKVNVGK
ncbi:TPA: hypothetical protein ACK3JW_001181 [Mannheimia haemolytica]